MKLKNIEIEVKSIHDSLNEAAEVMEKISRGEPVKTRRILSFTTLDLMRKFLTPERLKLMGIIRRQKPKSIYALAKLAKRDAKSVNTDVKVLADLGVVGLRKVKAKKNKYIPTVSFDKINVAIEL
jgi:predicted transcriptional regulator